MTTTKTFAEMRIAAKFTQHTLAIALGVTSKTVSNWESGRRPLKLSPSDMLILCQLFGISLAELADRCDYPNH